MVQNCSKSYIALYIKVYETRGYIGRLRNTFGVVLRFLWKLKKAGCDYWRRNLILNSQPAVIQAKWSQRTCASKTDHSIVRTNALCIQAFDLREHKLSRKSITYRESPFFAKFIESYLLLSSEFLAFHFVRILPRNNSAMENN